MKIEEYVSPQELRRLASVFLTVVLAITLLALFDFILVPSMRSANRKLFGAEPAPRGATGWLDPTEYPPTKGYVIPPVDPRTVISPTPEMLARGKALFPRYCVQCHGAQGRGDGPAAKTVNPPPRDFTKPQGWKNGTDLAGMYKTVSNGLPNSAMASFDYLTPKDRMTLVHYARSLAEFKRGPEETSALAKSFASSAVKVPNKIPISMAMRKLETESARP